jgi:hypothetical protein
MMSTGVEFVYPAYSSCKVVWLLFELKSYKLFSILNWFEAGYDYCWGFGAFAKFFMS